VSNDVGYRQKVKKLDEDLFGQFLEMRAKGNAFRDDDLKSLALQLARSADIASFTALQSWITKFRKRHGIVQRKIVHFRIKAQVENWDKILQSGAEYINEMNSILPQFDPQFVFNTDQTGFQKETYRLGTLELRGKRDITAVAGNSNALTHSQYSIQLP